MIFAKLTILDKERFKIYRDDRKMTLATHGEKGVRMIKQLPAAMCGHYGDNIKPDWTFVRKLLQIFLCCFNKLALFKGINAVFRLHPFRPVIT